MDIAEFKCESQVGQVGVEGGLYKTKVPHHGFTTHFLRILSPKSKKKGYSLTHSKLPDFGGASSDAEDTLLIESCLEQGDDADLDGMCYAATGNAQMLLQITAKYGLLRVRLPLTLQQWNVFIQHFQGGLVIATLRLGVMQDYLRF